MLNIFFFVFYLVLNISNGIFWIAIKLNYYFL